MSDYWYWRLLPCKETGSCNCFATADQSNEEKEEDTNHQVVVSDIMQLVRDKQEVPESTAVPEPARNAGGEATTVQSRTMAFLTWLAVLGMIHPRAW